MIRYEYDSWGIVPEPFNADYDKNGIVAHNAAIETMILNRFYDTHTRLECSIEFKEIYDIAFNALKNW